MDTEQLIYKLGKDVAVMAETQKACQMHQEHTTANVNKLAAVVDSLAKEAIRLEGIFSNITSVERKIDSIERALIRRLERIEDAYRTWSKVVMGAIFVAVIGVIFKYIGA